MFFERSQKLALSGKCELGIYGLNRNPRGHRYAPLLQNVFIAVNPQILIVRVFRLCAALNGIGINHTIGSAHLIGDSARVFPVRLHISVIVRVGGVVVHFVRPDKYVSAHADKLFFAAFHAGNWRSHAVEIQRAAIHIGKSVLVDNSLCFGLLNIQQASGLSARQHREIRSGKVFCLVKFTVSYSELMIIPIKAVNDVLRSGNNIELWIIHSNSPLIVNV